MWQIVWLGEPVPTTEFDARLMQEIYFAKNDWEKVEDTCAGILDRLNDLDEVPLNGSVNFKDQGWERIYQVIWRCPHKKGFFLRHRQSGEVALTVPLSNTLLNVDLKWRREMAGQVEIAISTMNARVLIVEDDTPDACVAPLLKEWRKSCQELMALTDAERKCCAFILRQSSEVMMPGHKLKHWCEAEGLIMDFGRQDTSFKARKGAFGTTRSETESSSLGGYADYAGEAPGAQPKCKASAKAKAKSEKMKKPAAAGAKAKSKTKGTKELAKKPAAKILKKK